MSNEMKMDDKELIRVVTGFRRGILGRRKSTKMCYAICWPLQGYLSIINFETVLSEGTIKLGGHNKGITINHFWLTLPDGRIIDPTSDQFNGMGNEDMPPIYLGKKPKWYRPKHQPIKKK